MSVAARVDGDHFELPADGVELLPQVRPADRQWFIDEVTQALAVAADTKDFGPLQDVLQAWTATVRPSGSRAMRRCCATGYSPTPPLPGHPSIPRPPSRRRLRSRTSYGRARLSLLGNVILVQAADVILRPYGSCCRLSRARRRPAL